MQNFKRILNITCFLSFIIISLPSCFPKTDDSEVRETAQIQEYLAENPTIGFVRKESGLYYADITAGTGSPANTHDTAYVFYSVKLLTGFILDSNFESKDTLVFPVNEGEMLAGFDEGVTYMKTGGSARLILPSKLAYGTEGNYFGSIGPYTPILIDVKLFRVVHPAAKK